MLNETFPPGLVTEVPHFLREGGAFTDPSFLDWGTTGWAVRMKYVSNQHTPEGLGRSETPFLPNNLGQWLIQPADGDFVVLKFPHGSSLQRSQLITEVHALMSLQDPIPTQSTARPVKLLCYGVAEHAPYLVLEYIDDSFKQLDRYLREKQTTLKPGSVDQLEALEIACGLADILNEAHSRGILHNDLGNLNNIFWNPQAKALRLIDWANSIDTNKYRESPTTFYHDRRGVVSILFRLITGQNPQDIKAINKFDMEYLITHGLAHMFTWSTFIHFYYDASSPRDPKPIEFLKFCLTRARNAVLEEKTI